MLKRLASDTAIYGLSSILGRLVNYLLVPLHTGLFNPDGYGIVSILYGWAAVLNIIYTYGMETAYFRHVGKKEVDERQLFNAGFSSLLLTAVIFSGVLIGNSEGIASFLGYTNSDKYVVWFALLIAADNIAVLPFARLRHQHKALRFASIRLINIGLNVVLNVFFLVICPAIMQGDYLSGLKPLVEQFYDPELGLGYAFLANLLASLALLPMLLPTYLNFRPTIHWPLLKSMYKYGYPLIFSGLFYTINEVLDRELIEHWLPSGFYEGVNSTGAVGIYSACYKLSIFISLAVQSYKYAAEPFFFSQKEKSPELLAKSMTYFVLILLLMFLGVSLNVGWIGHILIRQEAYWIGLGVVPILLMANLFLGIYQNLAFWYKLTDKTYYGAIISGGGALITLGANYLLIPYLGYFGSAITTFLCYFSMTAVSYFLGRKHFYVPYKVGRIFSYIISASLVVGFAFWIELEGMQRWIFNNSLLVLYIAWAAWREKAHIQAILRPAPSEGSR